MGESVAREARVAGAAFDTCGLVSRQDLKKNLIQVHLKFNLPRIIINMAAMAKLAARRNVNVSSLLSSQLHEPTIVIFPSIV